MRIDDFNRRLREAILVADGAMGSMLYEQLGPQRSFDELNASQPEAVFRVHQTYLAAGAQILETNTFGANRRKLAALGLADRVTELNHRGAKIAREAREASAHDVLIAGSIGPLGLAPQIEPLPPDEVRDVFREQAAALEERGVDFFILETFSRLDELLAAIEAVRSFSELPIVAELTYSEEGTTFDGTRPRDAAERLKERGPQVIGANCTIGPQLLLPVLRELAAVNGIQLSAMPNAGFPKRIGDRIVYPRSSPEYFAQFAREAAALGVRILGGCCGTTPDHIRAMVEALRRLAPADLLPPSPRARARAAAPQPGENSSAVEVIPPVAPAGREAPAPDSGFWRKLQSGRFAVSVEIDPPKGVSLDRIFEQVDRVIASGQVDAIDINSGTLARVGMDALLLAGALEARGVETIPHLTTRDLNIIGLQAMLLGAWSVGRVRNVLAITGDPPSLGDHPETSGVYEIDSVGLVKLVARLNLGADWAGKALGGATNFTIGVALNPVADDLDEEIRRFHAKVEAGAHFAMTQPLFDPAQWHAFLNRLGSSLPVPVLAGVWPLSSYKQAVRLNNEVPGISIPEPVLKELEAAGTRARDCGFALARRMLAWARTELAGAYLIPPFKRYEEILEVFD
jgi:methionine synthase / methylenetetrahydrofolate reductase (NADH)